MQKSAKALLADITTTVINNPSANIVCLPEKENLLRSIRITKQRAQGKPASLTELSELLNMPDSFKMINNNQQFLQKVVYTDKHNTQALVLFMSDAGKNLVANLRMWAGDGTFSTAPKLFKQIYFVGFITDCGRFIPAAYALLTNKTEETYMELLSAIVNAVGKFFLPEYIFNSIL